MRYRANPPSAAFSPRGADEARKPKMPMARGFRELYVESIYRILRSSGLTSEGALDRTQRYLLARRELMSSFDAFIEKDVFLSFPTIDRTIDMEIYSLVHGFGFDVKLVSSEYSGLEIVRTRTLGSAIVPQHEEKCERRYAVIIDPISTSNDPKLIAELLENLLALAKILASTVRPPPSAKGRPEHGDVHILPTRTEAA
ncbi:hypothetical protein HY988_01320 [Candidatus Micrarchaeota archaeon]|nr:hypothetical protein [Candidatus Micrarchaeota archaeon]